MNGEIKTCDLPISGFKVEDSSVRWCLKSHNSSFFSCFVTILRQWTLQFSVLQYWQLVMFVIQGVQASLGWAITAILCG